MNAPGQPDVPHLPCRPHPVWSGLVTAGLPDQPEQTDRVVLDTNVFVAAGFNPGSSSGQIVAAVAQGQLLLCWNDAVLGEIAHILGKIPPLDWADFAPLFRRAGHISAPTHPERFTAIPDPADRKFAALAAAANAILITQDDHLLAGRAAHPVTILTPGDYVDRCDPPLSSG